MGKANLWGSSTGTFGMYIYYMGAVSSGFNTARGSYPVNWSAAEMARLTYVRYSSSSDHMQYRFTAAKYPSAKAFATGSIVGDLNSSSFMEQRYDNFPEVPN